MVAGEQGVASLNQVRAQLWSGDARPEGHQWGMGFLGKGQPAPPHQVGGLGSAVSSSRGVRTPLGEHTAQAADVFSCNVPPDCLSWYLAYSFYTCKLQLCVELFMPIRLQHTSI